MKDAITDGSKHLVREKFNADSIWDAPCLMNFTQRLVLFALIIGTSPKSYLEVGTARGGSASIVDYAVDVLGSPDFIGVCIDLNFDRMEKALKERLSHRFTFIEVQNGIKAMQAAIKMSQTFDVVLIDALHDEANALFDILTVYPYVAHGGIILLDDANYFGVRAAIDDALRFTDAIDCGLISRHGGTGTPEIAPSWVVQRATAPKVEKCTWGGLYMLRKP